MAQPKKNRQPLKIRHHGERENVWRRMPQVEHQLNSDSSNKYQMIPTNITGTTTTTKNPDNPQHCKENKLFF